jgi:hypothetical protein
MEQVRRASGDRIEALVVRIQIRQSGEQAPRIRMARIVSRSRRSGLFRHLSGIHDVDEVGDFCDDAEVVGDVDDDGDASFS